jgi:hypothetical protein
MLPSTFRILCTLKILLWSGSGRFLMSDPDPDHVKNCPDPQHCRPEHIFFQTTLSYRSLKFSRIDFVVVFAFERIPAMGGPAALFCSPRKKTATGDGTEKFQSSML